MNVLFLFESILPSNYHKDTISPGELRVIASQQNVKKIFALGRSGKSFYDAPSKQIFKTKLEDKINLIHIHKFASNTWYYLSGFLILPKAISIIKNHKIDLIHAESPHITGITAIILKKIYKIPVIIEYRTSYQEVIKHRFPLIPYNFKILLFEKITFFAFTNSNLILANSQTYAKQIKSQYKILNVYFYNPGVTLPKKHPIRLDKVNSITIGFIGRHYSDKGLIYLLKAIKIIKAKSQVLNISFKIAGEGPNTLEARQYATKHDLSNVKFVGTQNKWQFFSQIDIHINTTIVKAALEMVNVESAAMKIPTICFGNNIYPETVIHNQTGLKVPNKNENLLAKAIIKLANDSKLRKQLGENAYTLYQKHYTFQKQVDNLTKAYNHL